MTLVSTLRSFFESFLAKNKEPPDKTINISRNSRATNGERPTMTSKTSSETNNNSTYEDSYSSTLPTIKLSLSSIDNDTIINYTPSFKSVQQMFETSLNKDSTSGKNTKNLRNKSCNLFENVSSSDGSTEENMMSDITTEMRDDSNYKNISPVKMNGSTDNENCTTSKITSSDILSSYYSPEKLITPNNSLKTSTSKVKNIAMMFDHKETYHLARQSCSSTPTRKKLMRGKIEPTDSKEMNSQHSVDGDSTESSEFCPHSLSASKRRKLQQADSETPEQMQRKGSVKLLKKFFDNAQSNDLGLTSSKKCTEKGTPKDRTDLQHIPNSNCPIKLNAVQIKKNILYKTEYVYDIQKRQDELEKFYHFQGVDEIDCREATCKLSSLYTNVYQDLSLHSKLETDCSSTKQNNIKPENSINNANMTNNEQANLKSHPSTNTNEIGFTKCANYQNTFLSSKIRLLKPDEMTLFDKADFSRIYSRNIKLRRRSISADENSHPNNSESKILERSKMRHSMRNCRNLHKDELKFFKY